MSQFSVPRAADAPADALPARSLAPPEKAAVIVRLLLAEGFDLPIATLPADMQADLAAQIARMRLVDRATMESVLREFLTMLEQAGLAFPDGIDGVLALMDGHLSQDAAARLRRQTAGAGDPWDRLSALPPERLLPVLQDEAPETAAVVLSKLPVPKAADLLSRLPGDRARRIAFAVSRTAATAPETVQRIGQALLQDLDAAPPRAFATGPVERVGAMLNLSPSATRDALLDGLEAEDAGFAAAVRKAIFTYAHIPARLSPRDAPKVIRATDPAALVTALAAGPPEVAEFLLANISARLADGLREDVAAQPAAAADAADRAMLSVVTAIRQLEEAGDLALIPPPG